MTFPYAAIVLAGGAGRRLGGVDKAALVVGRHTLLERALEAVPEASGRIVVGPGRSHQLPADVVAVCEDPPGGGPVAAIDAGLRHVSEEAVVVLACDMPLVTPALIRHVVDRLRAADRGVDGTLLIDQDGRRQPLAAAYRTASLRLALATLPATHGAAVKDLLRQMNLQDVPAPAGATLDCDTWDSVAACRDLLEEP